MIKPSSQILSSTPFQMLLYFHGWYDLIFIIITLILYIYKAVSLPYPALLALELCFLLIAAPLLEWARLYLGTRGNLTEQVLPLIFFLVLCVPTIMGHVYFLAWQAYVLQIEIPMNAISLLFLLAELIFAIIYIIVFQRSNL
ncbi:putative Transmembrane protein 80 [Paratrimastix pyriformis]|uniref:Transmembrane protein 80 n=1 Tax=Paratrimastix pyriformis TaxID=342808 RepID=A0ABQ8UIF8_9EUKA|nr:putative Transmembrane protein 80 [Paratrimastix pyriformis]